MSRHNEDGMPPVRNYFPGGYSTAYDSPDSSDNDSLDHIATRVMDELVVSDSDWPPLNPVPDSSQRQASTTSGTASIRPPRTARPATSHRHAIISIAARDHGQDQRADTINAARPVIDDGPVPTSAQMQTNRTNRTTDTQPHVPHSHNFHGPVLSDTAARELNEILRRIVLAGRPDSSIWELGSTMFERWRAGRTGYMPPILEAELQATIEQLRLINLNDYGVSTNTEHYRGGTRTPSRLFEDFVASSATVAGQPQLTRQDGIDFDGEIVPDPVQIQASTADGTSNIRRPFGPRIAVPSRRLINGDSVPSPTLTQASTINGVASVREHSRRYPIPRRPLINGNTTSNALHMEASMSNGANRVQQPYHSRFFAARHPVANGITAHDHSPVLQETSQMSRANTNGQSSWHELTFEQWRNSGAVQAALQAARDRYRTMGQNDSGLLIDTESRRRGSSTPNIVVEDSDPRGEDGADQPNTTRNGTS